MIVQHATRADWLRDRLNGIGGSDAPAVLGVSEYASPFSVWASRVYPSSTDAEPIPGTPQSFGLKHERANAEEIAAMLGAELIDLRANGSFCASVVLDEIPYLRSTPDFLIRDKEGRRALLQIKCVDSSKSSDWKGNAAPDEYDVQLQHEILTCQTMPDAPSYGILGAVIGGNRPAIRIRPFDEKFAEEWASIAAKFWRHVETKTPPAIDGRAATKRAALRLAAKTREDATRIFDGAGWRELAIERMQMDMAAKAAKARIDEIDSKFALEMADARRADVPGVGRMILIDVEETMIPPTFVPTPRAGYSSCRWYPEKNTAPRRNSR